MTTSRTETAETLLKWIGALVAVGGLLWGVTSFLITARIQAETRQLEARKPFLERQLTLYTQATQNASILATSSDPAAREKARGRFLELYWGELALVESEEVKDAMVDFYGCLIKDCPPPELQQWSLKLAHACRASLAASWGVQDWTVPTPTE